MDLLPSKNRKYYPYKQLPNYVLMEARLYKRELQNVMEPVMKDLESNHGWVALRKWYFS